MHGAITNATIVSMDKSKRVYSQAGILYKNGRIAAIDSSAAIQALAKDQGIPVQDAKEAVIFPGLINTHNHLFQHLLKGLGTDMSLEGWWPRVIGPAGVLMRERHVRAASSAGALEAIRSGTTTVVDYMQVHPVKGLSDAVIESVTAAGLRLVYGRGFRNYAKDARFPPELIDDIDDVFAEAIELKHRYEDETQKVKIYLAPAAAWAMSFDGLKRAAEFGKENGIPLMMHVFETGTDNEVCCARYGKRAIDYYEEAGLLQPDFLAVHCVAMDAEDIRRFAENDVKVSHNPVSNMYLASGIAPVPKLLNAGITVGLGTDGAASNNSNNMLETLKITALLHKVYGADPLAMTAYKVLEMATVDAAECIGLSDQIGSLEVGKRADFFVFDPLQSPGCAPMHDPVATLVYSSDTRGIVTVVAGGETLLSDGSFTRLDERGLLAREQAIAKELYYDLGFGVNAK
ncbi:MAG: amidohydrolase [Bacillota bacterium]